MGPAVIRATPTIVFARHFINVSDEPGVIMLLRGMTSQGVGRYIFGSVNFIVGCGMGVAAGESGWAAGGVVSRFGKLIRMAEKRRAMAKRPKAETGEQC
jgi:hypothetical protein